MTTQTTLSLNDGEYLERLGESVAYGVQCVWGNCRGVVNEYDTIEEAIAHARRLREQGVGNGPHKDCDIRIRRIHSREWSYHT